MSTSIFSKKPLNVKVVGRNLDDLLPLLRQFPVNLVDKDPDLVITYGGDGALLGAERDFPGIPKFPLRDARQNPKCPKHTEAATLEKLFAGELKTDNLLKLVAETPNGDQLTGINDIVITRKVVSSAIRYRIWIDGELHRPQVVADSLVVSTPFGSTGYFQSITNGNFLTGIGLAFNNAMDLQRYSVIDQASQITVELLRGPAVMMTDNDPKLIELDTNAQVRLRLSDNSTTVFGLEVFRCLDCYDLRKNGIPTS